MYYAHKFDTRYGGYLTLTYDDGVWAVLNPVGFVAVVNATGHPTVVDEYFRGE